METNQQSQKFQDISIAPMHTAEHLLNQTMVRLFNCKRSTDSHIEKKKSKISFILDTCPSQAQVTEITIQMNQLIQADLNVRYDIAQLSLLPQDYRDRLPANAGEIVRLVHIGDYDTCPCIGVHVKHTNQLGRFVLLGTNWDEDQHKFRIRFKLENSDPVFSKK